MVWQWYANARAKKLSGILQELRYQAETRFRLELYKKVEFPFLQSINVKHIFQPLDDLEYGNLGVLHLAYTVDGDNRYWKSTWYDNPMEVIGLAQSIQEEKEKIIDENAIINAQIRYMNSFVIDNTIPDLVN